MIQPTNQKHLLTRRDEVPVRPSGRESVTGTLNTLNSNQLQPKDATKHQQNEDHDQSRLKPLQNHNSRHRRRVTDPLDHFAFLPFLDFDEEYDRAERERKRIDAIID